MKHTTNPKTSKYIKERTAKPKPISSLVKSDISTHYHKKDISATDKIALFIIGIVGTFEFFVLCNILIIIPFAFPPMLAIVQFISSGWLQLILLPIIVISQNIDTRHNKKMEEKILAMEINIEKLLINK